MLALTKLKTYRTSILFSFISAVLYFIFAYQFTRNDPIRLFLIYSGLFLLFYLLVKIHTIGFNFLVFTSFLFRFVFLFSIPNLSQDFYRFIWDGRMILEGLNPYLYTPESFISKEQFPVNQSQELYHGMRNLNASHFTNYPPINQLCFVIASFFSGKSILGSVIVMRLILIFSDLGILYFGKKLLSQLKMPVRHIFWYLLNPFIIIELTGNLHFEALMIFFLVWSLYLLHIGKWKLAAVLFSLSISVKLIPLLFLPLLYQKLGLKKSILFYGIVGAVTLLLFMPFYSPQFINNYTQTVGLWFQNFEFNASVYYLLREIGYLFRGWNEIAIIGKILPVTVLLFTLIITFVRKNKTTIELITVMLFTLSFYYFTSTTVHPWYIATLLALSIFTKYTFPLVWSFIIFISYLAYVNIDNTENLYIITFEYLVVYGVLVWELMKNKTVSNRV